MVEASFSSNQCKSFSLWPVGIAYTGTQNEKCLQLRFSSFKEPACDWLCRVGLPHLLCPLFVSAAPGNLPTVMYHGLSGAHSCLQLAQPRAWEAELSRATLATMTVSAMGLFHVTCLEVSPHLLELS